MKKKSTFPKIIVLCFILVSIILSSCRAFGKSQPISASSEVVETATPLKTATLCTAKEPTTLFYYDEPSEGAEMIFAALYDGPFDWVGYQVQPVILEEIPSVVDGSASYAPVQVKAGDLVIDSMGNIATLAEGLRLFPSGCQAMDCAITWDGFSSLQMDQLTLLYMLKEGVRWSDGEPVKANDVQFAYQVAKALESSRFTKVVDRILTYESLDERRVRVTLLPGLLTADYAQFFFSPLPEHTLKVYPISDLPEIDAATKMPMGWGAFQIKAWQQGQSITLEKNPYYFRNAEGYPALDEVEVRFLPLGISLPEMLSTYRCDVIDNSLVNQQIYADLPTLQNDSSIRIETLPGENWEVLLFGIRPSSYDDGYYPYGSDRPDLFSDSRVRNAIRQCVDRDAIVKEQTAVGNAHPFVYFPYDISTETGTNSSDVYDPAAANAALEELGWKDYDANPATPRVAKGVVNVPDGTVFSVALYTSEDAKDLAIAEEIRSSLMTCGIQIEVKALPPAELYAEGPEGVLFGRKFDLALIPWHIGESLPCALFESEEIPAEDNYWIGMNDGGGNIAGYQNSAFDALCNSARYGSNEQGEAFHAQVEAGKILDNETPFISLFFDAKTILANSQLCFSNIMNTQGYPYSTLEYWDFRDTCK